MHASETAGRRPRAPTHAQSEIVATIARLSALSLLACASPASIAAAAYLASPRVASPPVSCFRRVLTTTRMLQQGGDTPAADASSVVAPVSEAVEKVAALDVSADAEAVEDPIVQFVVIRRDLLKTLEWPVGSVVAQACHACLAVTWEHRDDPDVAAYLSPENINSMHKVTKECKGEPQLLTLAEKLQAEGVAHRVWMEQPENIPTAIALKPYPRSRVAPLLKKYQLFR